MKDFLICLAATAWIGLVIHMLGQRHHDHGTCPIHGSTCRRPLTHAMQMANGSH